mgnify:FL=1
MQMPITPLDMVGKQFESAAKNQLRSAQAEVRRETSIVGYANARLGNALHRLNPSGRTARTSRKEENKSGVYVQEHPAIVAPDGYVRRSPVQPLRVAPDYRKRLIKRIIGGVVLVLLVLGVALLLLKYLF